ncbi:MAG TPA: PQQ-dependent sugar dehydrogenase [Gemmatimonadaceae bacterium]|nr:PQQ-dependent sugar dehydrogenase [Gemmatimonadaceae bacterium]
MMRLMMPARPAPRALAASLLLLLAPVACHDSTAAATTGALAVAVGSLPEGFHADVVVTGPSGYSRTLSASETLSSLVPGTYTVTAHDVLVDATRWMAIPATQSVIVHAGGSASATVRYDVVQLALRPVVSGLASPVYLTAPAGDARLFVVEQAGRIRVVKGGALLATPFLDISGRVSYGGERGLLSMAFDPAYATNGWFYVYFTNPAGDIAIERFASTPGADVASADAPTPVITIPHPTYGNHNGGLLLFGPDGMLYAGTGDGGGGGDPSGNAQNTNVLLGKLLRLDVHTLPYTVPPTNPFAGQAGKRGEIWAYGLRNPWRYAFDTPAGVETATLYIADVGQGSYEEIDVSPAADAGVNYGWNRTEGAHCYPSGGTACDMSGIRLPALEYDHSQGCSITGGFVYRGAALPEVAGHYFYSDYCGGWLASMTGDAAHGFATRRWDVPNVGNVTSFGRDAAGELYVLTGSGTVYEIVRR